MSDDANDRLLDIEVKLKDDHDGTYKASLRAQLEGHLQEVEKKLNAGVSPSEYGDLNAILVGLQSARLVLERVWLQHHGK